MTALPSDNGGDIVLDFFAGSCTTAHAVMKLNLEDGGNRRFIMVQLPEKCGEKTEAFKAGYPTIADIGKERIRRAAQQLNDKTSHPKSDKPNPTQTDQPANHLEEKQPLDAQPGNRQKQAVGDLISPSSSPALDNGFRVLKIGDSNFKDCRLPPHEYKLGCVHVKSVVI